MLRIRVPLCVFAILVATACQDMSDIIPPKVEILSPLDGVRMTGQANVVIVASDAHLKQVLAYLDGNLVGQGAQETLSFTCTIPDSSNHTIQAKAVDRRGNFAFASCFLNPVSDVEVKSTPTGANVWIDEVSTGDTTDCTLRNVGTGLHGIKLTKTGYLDWQETLTVVRGQKASVNATLTANVGSIQVNSSPTGAAIWLDGQPTGRTTDCVVAGVQAGVHTVKLTKSDYWDWEDTVTVTLGATATRSATLQSNPYPTHVIANIPLPSGSSPSDLAWNSTDNRLYCANSATNNVSVIDCATNSITATVGVGSNPDWLEWNATNNTVYCSNWGSDNITVFNGATNAYITTIPVGSHPVGLVWNANTNKVYCVCYEDTMLWVIDGATNSVSRKISIGYYYGGWSLACNSTNNKVYVGFYGADEDEVVVLDGSTDQVVGTVVTSGYVTSMAWDQTDNRIYGACSSEVVVIDGVTNQLITSIQNVDYAWALTWNGANNKIYCANSATSANNPLDIIDCSANSIVDRLDGICYNTADIVHNAISNRVYVTYFDDPVSSIKVIGQ